MCTDSPEVKVTHVLQNMLNDVLPNCGDEFDSLALFMFV